MCHGVLPIPVSLADFCVLALVTKSHWTWQLCPCPFSMHGSQLHGQADNIESNV